VKTRAKLVWLELTEGLFGWVWLLATPAALYFFGAALFFHRLLPAVLAFPVSRRALSGVLARLAFQTAA
jgi:hypothetical protein